MESNLMDAESPAGAWLSAAKLFRYYIIRLWAFLPLANFHRDFLALAQGFEAFRLD